MKNSRKHMILIILLLSLVLIKPLNLESKAREENDIIVTPQAMGVYEKWSFTTGSSVYSSPFVADLDFDGTAEILIGSHDSNLYCLNHTGGKEWNYTVGGGISSSPAFADIDDD